ncbi:TIGR02996 domain-containing protein [Gemmata sp.]|uniref:TIGR02996 domain-containing protein n=1 Tax=Gemmata sp. TaxID=1914242 RepID=UPI003F711B00
MTDEDALLATICANPDDDMPRLAFADWLDEQGGRVNSGWAELIRAEIVLARGGGADRTALAERDRELTAELKPGWSDRMGFEDGLSWENWIRGFPITLAGPGGAIVAARRNFANRIPIREFNLRDTSDADVVEFTRWPELTLVYKLGAWADYGAVTQRSIFAMAGCEYLSNLERLRMQWVTLSDAAAVAFLESPYMARIIDIRMSVAGLATSLSDETMQRIRGRFGDWGIR